ncbi:MAG: hypothetical protein GEU90_21445 [Gemmatimonas sp.]|nr:hypothetical protein [Gemmatimonas sp.]
MKLNRVRGLGDSMAWKSDPEAVSEPMIFLRAAAAQLLLATGAETTLAHTTAPRHLTRQTPDRHPLPTPLAWAPALIGTLAALAHVEQIRRPSERTTAALRILDAATVATGCVLLAYDLFATDGKPPSPLGSLAFASAGFIGATIERQERELRRAQLELRRRADVVERLIPRRKAKLDRVVIHV